MADPVTISAVLLVFGPNILSWIGDFLATHHRRRKHRMQAQDQLQYLLYIVKLSVELYLERLPNDEPLEREMLNALSAPCAQRLRADEDPEKYKKFVQPLTEDILRKLLAEQYKELFNMQEEKGRFGLRAGVKDIAHQGSDKIIGFCRKKLTHAEKDFKFRDSCKVVFRQSLSNLAILILDHAEMRHIQ